MNTEFERIVREHRARYPLMQPQDYGKLAYQSEFGPEHLVTDEDRMLDYIREEWSGVEGFTCRAPEDIGGGLCRFHLNPDVEKTAASEVLIKLFRLTSEKYIGNWDGLEEKLSVLEKLPVSGMGEWLKQYRAKGCPAVHHSEVYRAHYTPHYRLLKQEYARFFPALLAVAKQIQERGQVVLAIDGRCGSGKTSLAELMEQVFDCNVFHMDDFYLPLEKREDNWLEIPGGNMDLERFRREVLEPAFAGETVFYRPYDCGQGVFKEAYSVRPRPLTVIEGSYSHHPALEAEYDVKLFVTCEKEEQLRRLQEREGDYFPTFQRLWMPLEEQYIRMCGIERSDAMLVDTGIIF